MPRRTDTLPASLAPLFPELDPSKIRPERDRDYVLTRLLERGRWEDVVWCKKRYGMAEIHDYFRRAAHAELSMRTVNYWRVVLHAEKESWPTLPEFRQRSARLWPS